MKRRMVRMALLAGVIALSGQNVRADDDKPLAPGVLSLDSSVGVARSGDRQRQRFVGESI